MVRWPERRIPIPKKHSLNYLLMNKALFTIFVIVSQSINAQNGEDLFAEMELIDSIDQQLLPDRMLFTQRLLWGGILKKTFWSR